jgi:carbamoyl-phosphate synthase large subunit
MSILVTGIGGMVGQGVLKNIRRTYNNRFRLIGTDTNALNAGSYLCDKAYKVPPAYQTLLYVEGIKQICFQEDVRLIIPTTDDEMYYLARCRHTELEAYPIAGSPVEISQLGLNKYKNYTLFTEKDIPFAETCLPSEYKGQWKDIIVKPHQGRGSRGITINPDNVEMYDDITYIVQELLQGEELTIAFYVKRNGQLHGWIVFRRELKNGYTNMAEVVFEYNDQVGELINKMLHYFPFRGSINIQAKVKNGMIIPFELNCRFSGTNSIRSRFGFQDVKYIVQEYLMNEEPTPVHVLKGSAIRIIQDLIYPETNLNEIHDGSGNYIF